MSIGTVDRALHDKPGINPGTRRRVLDTAGRLGYRPNLAARHLKSRTTFRISVHLPEEIALFWDSLRDGIREAAAPFAPTLSVEFRSNPRLGEGEVELFEQALASGVNGLIVAPGDPAALEPLIRRAARQNIPVVCVVTDAPCLRAPDVGLGRPVHRRVGGRRTAVDASCPAAATSRSSPGGSAPRTTPRSSGDSGPA